MHSITICLEKIDPLTWIFLLSWLLNFQIAFLRNFMGLVLSSPMKTPQYLKNRFKLWAIVFRFIYYPVSLRRAGAAKLKILTNHRILLIASYIVNEKCKYLKIKATNNSFSRHNRKIQLYFIYKIRTTNIFTLLNSSVAIFRSLQ